MSEQLIILSKGRTAAELESVAAVRQRFGDRVFVVAIDDAGGLHALGAVFANGSEASHAETDLTQTEQMGIDAWNARPALAKKKRPGEGLSWDAEGFEAP